jgi:hypothetical protein
MMLETAPILNDDWRLDLETWREKDNWRGAMEWNYLFFGRCSGAFRRIAHPTDHCALLPQGELISSRR